MKKLFGVLILVALWQFGSTLTSPLFVPSPAAVFNALIGLAESDQLLPALAYSFTRISVAALLAVAVAVPMALLLCLSKTLDEMIGPIVSAMRYIPVTAFSPLLILWFGIEEEMKVSFLFLATFVYVLPTTILCLKEVPDDLIDTGKSIGMKQYQIITEVLLPAAMPSIADSVLMMYGIGWTYVAVIEAVNAKYGLGYIINTAAARGKTSVVFAAIIVIVLFSYVFDKLGNFLNQKIFRWRYIKDDPIE
jgi:NitT/TauT family transport system permease protein